MGTKHTGEWTAAWMKTMDLNFILIKNSETLKLLGLPRVYMLKATVTPSRQEDEDAVSEKTCPRNRYAFLGHNLSTCPEKTGTLS